MGKSQAFLRDREGNGLRVRVTANGAKSFVFEQKLDRQTIRKTIGDMSAWSIADAQKEARRLAGLLDREQDPRELERQRKADEAARKAAAEAQAAQDKARAVTVGDVWPVYLQHGKPKRRDAWKPRYL